MLGSSWAGVPFRSGYAGPVFRDCRGAHKPEGQGADPHRGRRASLGGLSEENALVWEVSVYKVTMAEVQEMLDDDPSLNTLKNQFDLKKIFDLIENRDQITNEDQLYEALLDVMYATRPQGVT